MSFLIYFNLSCSTILVGLLLDMYINWQQYESPQTFMEFKL